MIVLLLGLFFSSAKGKEIGPSIPKLKFQANGSFKVVQFTDTHVNPATSLKTIELMSEILDKEKPDLAVLTGDIIDGRNKTLTEVKQSIDSISKPLEERKIPWAIVFGNHDEEQGFLDKNEMMKLYMSYPNNISKPGDTSVDGIGNYNLLVFDKKGKKPIFNIYMIDSGAYASDNSGGYDWIKQSQIGWYKQTSYDIKRKFHRTIPSIMFFHIPLPEWREVWKSGKASGVRNEEECTADINSGLFNALVECGDVKGVFTGHDHLNDYVGELKGIKLGYSRSLSYAPYKDISILRGARIFLIKDSEPNTFETWMDLEHENPT